MCARVAERYDYYFGISLGQTIVRYLPDHGYHMPVKNSPVSIHSRQARETARVLRDLAAEAERGNCIGAVVAYFDNNNAPRFFSVGYAESKPREGSWLATKLANALMILKS